MKHEHMQLINSIQSGITMTVNAQVSKNYKAKKMLPWEAYRICVEMKSAKAPKCLIAFKIWKLVGDRSFELLTPAV